MSIAVKPPLKTLNQSILVKNDKLTQFYAPHHYHQDYEIIYIKKSRGIRVVGNNIDNYKPGEVILLGPRLPHYHVLGENVEGEDYAIETIAVLFPESIFEVNKQFPEFDVCTSILDEIKYGLELKGETCLKVQKLLETMTLEPSYHNFVTLFQLLGCLGKDDSQYVRLSSIKYDNMRKYDDKTKHVLDYVASHFQEKITVSETAQYSGMSLSGFSVFFKAQTGYTFSQYLNLLRISKATELLATSSRGVAEIAFEVGYDNLAYFNRKFKEIKKKTPREVWKDFSVG